MRLFYSIFFLWLVCASCAVRSAANRNIHSGTTIATATQRRTLPGARGSKPQTEYTLTLIWREGQAPYNFLWRAEGVWYSCRFDITQSDTVYVYANRPTAAPKDLSTPIPNTLYFTTQTGSWKTLQAPAIKRLPDVIMP